MNKLIGVLLVIATLSSVTLGGQNVAGVVIDDSGNPIAGVNIMIDGTKAAAVSSDKGEFILDLDLTSPRFVTFSHVAYQPVMIKVTSGTPLSIKMSLATYPMQGITVSEERATFGKSPIAFTDFTNKEIKRDYTIGEFPLLLETTPNLYAYSDAGGGLGYSYMKIRGFDDKRLSVYINGVPLNDPEDQATYFVDLPDFASNVKDIQVQRGIGNSLYGDASFGGNVNIVSGGLEQPRQVSLASGYGGFYHDGDFIGDIQKQSIDYQSGLIDGKWNLAGRYSRQLSDGYRRNSWYNGWSYFLSLSRLDPKASTVLNVYGGPMRMHLAYIGASRDVLKEDRRYNPLTYNNETDNFNQPHYELHNTLKLSETLTLHNTLFHIHGDGYYEQFKQDSDLSPVYYSDYNIPAIYIVGPGTDTMNVITRGDLVRQQWVDKNQWGWNPRLEIGQSRGDITIGGSVYYFESDHWGQVVWAEGLTNQIDPRHRYYQYFGKKYFASAYASETRKLTDRLNMSASLQFRHQTYDFDQLKIGAYHGYSYGVNWNFLSPRLGFTYTLDDRTSLLLSYSLSNRAPADYEIYDAGDPSAFPSLRIKAIHFATSTDSTIQFGDPTAKSETVHNFELGLNFRNQRQTNSVNFYWMEFRNEIIPYGGINTDLGLPITTNANRSVHAGVEMSSSQSISDKFKLSGNISASYNRIKDFSVSEPVYDNDQNYTQVGYATFNYANNRIAGFPDYIGNLLGEYVTDRIHLTYRARFIGRTYVENSDRWDLSIPPYFTSSVSASLSLGQLLNIGNFELAARVDNIFNKEYEASGYGGVTRFRDMPDQYWSEYIPAAERSFYTVLRLSLQ